MARMCCSNCEVFEPSIVQWPLLWTRGAISLTTGPSAQAKNSTVITPTWPSLSATSRRDRDGFGGLRVDLGAGRDFGASQDAAVVDVARDRPGRGVAVAGARAVMTENSLVKCMPFSATAGRRPIASHAAAASSARATQAWPLPS